MSTNYLEQDNDWANNIEENPIHITQAESGAKGYYCMGCGKEMQAVKRKKKEYKSYFRHHVKDVDNSKTECVHASREYREKLAFFYFMRTKQITVPSVYKFPPKGVEGYPNLLKDKETIFAHKVDKEVTFFEDEDGIIHWGKDVKVEERYLWVRPDAVFFDKDGKPILFIEFVVTHKPDIDKLNKLQRLGINTVQIVIPKLPESELEKEISKVSKIKWTYNEIESNTEYVPISEGNTEGIPSIDDDQRKLFEESYKCRAAQVGNLIRSITRCLESQSYKRTERLFEQEIQRIEKATREHHSRLDEIQEGIENEIYSELGNRREEIDSGKEEFRKYCSGLEKRYNTKRDQLIEEESYVDAEIEFGNNIGKSEEDIRKEFDRKEREIKDGYSFEEGVISIDEEGIRNQIIEISGNEEKIRADIDKRRKGGKSRYKENYESIRKRINSLRDEFKRKERDFIEQLEEEERKFISGIRNDQETIETEIQNYRRRIIQHMEGNDNYRIEELPDRIKKLSYTRRILNDWEEKHSTYKRYRLALEYLKKGTWKEWN